jgi:GDP-L-fucose synthase
MRKIWEAKKAGASNVTVWGTGAPLREFLHVDDLAAGVVYCLDNYDGHEHINCGSGSEITIRQLAETICDVVGYSGELVFDTSKPDGTPRKVMDSGRLRRLGWVPNIALERGIAETFSWFLESIGEMPSRDECLSVAAE